MSVDQLRVEEFVHTYPQRLSQRTSFTTSLSLILSDVIALMFCYAVGFFIVNLFAPLAINAKSFVLYWPYIPAFIVVLGFLNLYPGILLPPVEELRRYTIASFFGHAGIVLSLYIAARGWTAYSVAFAISWLASIPVFPIARAACRSILREKGLWGIPVVVFGDGEPGRKIVDRLLAHPSIGYMPAALFDVGASGSGNYRGVPVFSGSRGGADLAGRCGVDTAVVAMRSGEDGRITAAVGEEIRRFRHYVFIPECFGIAGTRTSVREIDGLLGLHTTQELLLPGNRAVKRFFDIALTIVGSAVCLPFIGIVALLVKLDSPGPVFYGHHRLGKDGVPFKAWKFRSMVENSQEVLDELLATDPAAKAEWAASFKLRDDPRITRMGRFLRKTSLDELPQLWNVLKGEMSLVGPRPIIEEEVPKYGEHYRLFASVKPGLSGFWQVSGRSDTDYDERVALDVYYIQNWSLWLDLHILFKTVQVVIAGEGAY